MGPGNRMVSKHCSPGPGWPNLASEVLGPAPPSGRAPPVDSSRDLSWGPGLRGLLIPPPPCGTALHDSPANGLLRWVTQVRRKGLLGNTPAQSGPINAPSHRALDVCLRQLGTASCILLILCFFPHLGVNSSLE